MNAQIVTPDESGNYSRRAISKRRHPMKTILVLSILFWAIALPALGELTDADLDKIRLIVKEEVKTEITGVKTKSPESRRKSPESRSQDGNCRSQDGNCRSQAGTESRDCQLREKGKRVYQHQNRQCRKTFINIQLGDLRPNASYCRYDRYTHSHHGVAERKGSLTRKTG